MKNPLLRVSSVGHLLCKTVGKAVFKVGTEGHFGKDSLLEVECTPADGDLQAHSIGVQIYLLQ